MSHHHEIELIPIQQPTLLATPPRRSFDGNLRVDSNLRVSNSSQAAVVRASSNRTANAVNSSYSPGGSVNTQDAIMITNHNNNAMYTATADQSASGNETYSHSQSDGAGAREGDDGATYEMMRRMRYRYSDTGDGDDYTPDTFVARHALRATRPGLWAVRRRHHRHHRDRTMVSTAVRTLPSAFPSRTKARIAGLVQMFCIIISIVALSREASPIPLILLLPALFASSLVQFHCRSDELIAIEDRTLQSTLKENSTRTSLKVRKYIHTRNMAFVTIAMACVYAPVCTFFCGFPLLILLFGDSSSIGGSSNIHVSWDNISAYLQIGRIICFASVPVSSIALARYYVLLKDEGFHFGESRQAALWRLALVTIRDLQRRVIDIETQELGEEEEEEEEIEATTTREDHEGDDDTEDITTDTLGVSTLTSDDFRRRSGPVTNGTPQLAGQATLTQSMGSVVSTAQPILSQLNVPVFTNAFAQRAYAYDAARRASDNNAFGFGSGPLDAGSTFVSEGGAPTFLSSAGGNTPNQLAGLTAPTLDMPIIAVGRFSATNTANNSTTQHPGQIQTAMNTSMSLDIPTGSPRTGGGFGILGVNFATPVATVTTSIEVPHHSFTTSTAEHRSVNRVQSFVTGSELGTTDSRTATFIERRLRNQEQVLRRRALREARRAAFFIDIWSIHYANRIPIAAVIAQSEELLSVGDNSTTMAAGSVSDIPSIGERTEPPTLALLQQQNNAALVGDVYAYEEDGTIIPKIAEGLLVSEYVARRIRQLREGTDEVVRLARENPAAFGGEAVAEDGDSRADDGAEEGIDATTSAREANINGARGPMSLLAALLASVIQTQMEGDEGDDEDGVEWNADDDRNSMNQLQNHIQPYRPDRVVPLRPEASVTFTDIPPATRPAADQDPQSAATIRRIVSSRAAAAASVVARSFERHQSVHSIKHSMLLPQLSMMSLPQVASSPSSPVAAAPAASFENSGVFEEAQRIDIISPSMAGSAGGMMAADGKVRRMPSKARRRVPLREVSPEDFYRDKRVGGRYY